MVNDVKVTNLRCILRNMQRVVVAYSGGVDSTLLACIANEELGAGTLALTAVSPSLPRSDLEEAQRIARQFNFAHALIETHEIEDANYQANTALRCYWCRKEVYGRLTRYAQAHGFAGVVDGANLDDTGDHRPGRKAASEYGVRSPFIEAQFSKQDIRDLSRDIGLPNWDKPAAACLSSRIPYGIPVTIQVLSQVEQAETLLHRLGIRQARVRHHGEVARIEIHPQDFDMLIAQREQILEWFRSLGYTFVALDLEGYKMGSMNQLIKESHET